MSALWTDTRSLDGTRVTAAEAFAHIGEGATVFLEQGACEPLRLHSALLDGVRNSHRRMRLIAAPVANQNMCEFGAEDLTPYLDRVVFVGTPELAASIQGGTVSYAPMHWSEVIGAVRDIYRPDVALIKVTPPDVDGFCNLSGNGAFELEIALLAETVIAEVDVNAPWVGGDTRLHQSQIDCWVGVEDGLRPVRDSAWGDLEARIAENVVQLLPRSLTLQIGPGRVPNAVLSRLLEEKFQVGIHSGILTDGMMQLAERQGSEEPVVAGMLLGTEELYEKVHRHHRVQLRHSDYTHAPAVLSHIDRFIAINSAIEVDLFGQVNAESVDGRQVSGVGGQLDFFRGARASDGGLAIIALPASTRTRSRIVAQLAPGVPVSTPRVDIDYVVTEFGAARLDRRTEGERAEALISVAAPEHRDALRAAWRSQS